MRRNLKDYFPAETLLLQQIRETEVARTEYMLSPRGEEFLRVVLMSKKHETLAFADFLAGVTLVLGEREV